MLDVYDSAVLLETLNLSGKDLTGEEAVLGEVLPVTSAVCRTVDTCACTVDLTNACMHHLEGECLHSSFNKFIIEGCRKDNAGGECHEGSYFLGCVGLNTGRTVVSNNLGRAYGRNCTDNVASYTANLDSFFPAHLVEKMIPKLAVIVNALKHNKRKRAALVGDGVIERHCCIRIVNNTCGYLHIVYEGGITSLKKYGRGGICCIPVATGEVGDLLILSSLVEIKVCVIKLVGNGVACGRYRIGLVIVLVDSLSVCKGVVTLGLVAVLVNYLIIVNVKRAVASLCLDNVVERIVRVLTNCKIVVACLEDVGSHIVRVVGLELVIVNNNGVVLALTGLKNVGLGVTNKLYRGLFNIILLVILGIGLLEIDLNGCLTCHKTCVGNGNRYVIIAVLFLHSHIGVLEGGVGDTVAEGVLNLLLIAPAACRVNRACSRGCVAKSENAVLVTGLVVTVAYVDTLLVNDVLVVVGVSIEVICRKAACTGKLKCACVNSGRSRVILIYVGINKSARGVYLTREHVVKSAEGCVTAHTCPNASIDVIVINGLHLHSSACVKNKNKLLEGGTLQCGECRKGISLVLCKVEVVVVNVALVLPALGGVNSEAGIIPGVTVLGTVTADEVDCSVSVLNEGGACSVINVIPSLFIYLKLTVMLIVLKRI